MWNNKFQLFVKFLRSEKFLFIYQMYFAAAFGLSRNAPLRSEMHNFAFEGFFEKSKGQKKGTRGRETKS